MAEIVGVVFPGGVKVYHFDPAGLELAQGDQVVVQTSSGPEIGQVAEPTHVIDDSEVLAALKKVQRVATTKDLEARAANEALRREAMIACRELIHSHRLDMKLVGAEVCCGGEKVTFSFSSEERVDFRGLVADLAKTLKMRVELRQVGAREEARMVGGLGPCGRGLCCATFPGNDDPVSIRMAKEQNLPLNPTKISGLCGRLMCCLKYEQEQYVCFRKEAPPKGTRVVTPTGEGAVTGYLVTKEALAVRMEDGSQAEVRLRTCERQEDGSLLVTPEEEPVAPAPWFVGNVGVGRSAAQVEADEYMPPADGRGPQGQNGQPVEGAGADGTGPARSRRSRGRRRGRGRGQGPGQPPGESPAAGGQPDGQPAGGRPAGGQRRSGGPRPDGPQQGGGESGSGREGNVAREGAPGSEGGGTGAPRSRRRRRPRRPGGAAGGGPGNASGGGNGGAAGGGL